MRPASHRRVKAVRRQLTLFVAPEVSVALERIRALVDPVQRGLIAAHVTLCREDELAGLSDIDVDARVRDASHGPLTLTFGRATPFASHGVLLNCIEGQHAFDGLRERLLQSAAIEKRAAHITLAHPRNPKAPVPAMDACATLPNEVTFTFANASLIEQRVGEPWRVRRSVALALRR
jgi:hypothetical protein